MIKKMKTNQLKMVKPFSKEDDFDLKEESKGDAGKTQHSKNLL